MGTEFSVWLAKAKTEDNNVFQRSIDLAFRAQTLWAEGNLG